MSERLTILTTKGPALKLDNPGDEEEARQQLHDKYLEAIGKLYYFEVLDEAGLITENPCKPGSRVHCLERYPDDEDGEWECSGYIFMGACMDYVMVMPDDPAADGSFDDLMKITERESLQDEPGIKLIHKENVFMKLGEAYMEKERRRTK